MPVLSTATRPLSRLRSDLRRLRLRRALVRFGCAASTAGLLLVAFIAVAFVLDFSLGLERWPRAAMLLVVAGTAGWVSSHWVGNWLSVTETETDLALMVETRHGLDGDLVAALQFQSEEATTWGSSQLEQAVVRGVDDASREIDVFQGFSWKPLPARWAGFVIAVAAATLLAFQFPVHSRVFFQRLLLADVSYPTRTQIASLTINGQVVELNDTTTLRAPAGRPLVFSVSHAGERPASGTVALIGDSGVKTAIFLKSSNRASEYSGSLESLTEPVVFKVGLGDAVTRSRRIEVVPPPVVSLRFETTPPEYARANAPATPPAGARTAFVLENTSVEIVVESSNKPLQQVQLVMEGTTLPLESSPDGKSWTLKPASTPFERIREPLNFTFRIVDKEGLAPPEPLAGSIRLRADRPPRVTAAAAVRKVLPTARPEVSYAASDDFGVKEVKAIMAVRRAESSPTEQSLVLPFERSSEMEVSGRQQLDLSSLQLTKGDQVVVTITAVDARGDQVGESASAEPLMFEVTDREGLLSGLLESDEEGAERLDAIIRRELGIGAQR